LFAGIDIVIDDPPFSTDDAHGALRVASSHLARFSELPAAALMTGVTVTRLLAGDQKQIVAAEIVNHSGEREIVESRAFVVAAGGLETPRLLLCSRSPQFPHGIGNDFDCVGTPFMEHKGLRFYGLLEKSGTETLEDSLNAHCHQFYTSFKKRGLGSILLFIMLADRIHLSGWDAELPMELNAAWKAGPLLLRIAASVELQAAPDNRVVLDDRRVDQFGTPLGRLVFNHTPLDRETIGATIDLIHSLFEKLSVKEVFRGSDGWGGHHMGTCRMGDDPRTSVVDPQLKVYGTSNLFLSGSSVFVTGGASNPTLTIVALTLRLADQICHDFACERL
jgi:choline dehydrogenase-like flavoprotein